MYKPKCLVTFFFTCIFFTSLYPQTRIIDSLKQQLTVSNQNKLPVLFALCRQGESLPSDTFALYAKKAKEISIDKNDQANSLLADVYIARYYNWKGMTDTALKITVNDMQEITDVSNSFELYHQLWWQKIVSLTKLRKIEESLNECYKLLESGEKYNDQWAQVTALNNIGVNYNVLRNRSEAINWFNQAYHLIKDSSLYRNYPLVFTNLASCYFSDNKNDSAQFFLDKAFEYARENQNLRNEADCYSMEGQLYAQQKKTDSAERMLQKAVQLQKQIGNIQFIMVGMDALQSFYADEKNYTKAIESIQEAEQYSKQFHEPLSLSFYNDLAGYYKLTNNFRLYGETLDTMMQLKDSLYQKSRAEDLAKLEAQYELSNKEGFIAKQKLELLDKDIWIATGTTITLVILAAGYLLFRRNKRRQLIALKNAGEKERKRIAADLHDNIGAYASAISAGVDEIENKKLVPDILIMRNLKDNATEIITSLRDTIWALDKQSISLTGISDRTKNYIHKIQPAYKQFHIDVEENIEREKNLSPMQALNTFRIIQEALHNALEHSKGNKIIININSNEELAMISVHDNGTGFDPQQVQNHSNGVMNMKNRAKESGFNISFERSDPGTKIILIAKI